MKQLATLVLAASTAFAQAPTLDAQAAAQATAQPVAPTPTLDRVALSADKELARSIDELNALRDCLCASTLPRHLATAWFEAKTGARKLERRR